MCLRLMLITKTCIVVLVHLIGSHHHCRASSFIASTCHTCRYMVTSFCEWNLKFSNSCKFVKHVLARRACIPWREGNQRSAWRCLLLQIYCTGEESLWMWGMWGSTHLQTLTRVSVWLIDIIGLQWVKSGHHKSPNVDQCLCIGLSARVAPSLHH